MSDRFPLPDPDFAATRPFFEAAARNELSLPQCVECGDWCWYPADRCRSCTGEAFDWKTLSGEGELFSWAVVERAFAKAFGPRVPFVAALVVPVEAPHVRIPSNVVHCPVEKLEIGMRLRAVFLPLQFEGVPGSVVVPFFEPG